MTFSWRREDTMLGTFQSSAEAVRRARAFQARPPASDGVEMVPVPNNRHWSGVIDGFSGYDLGASGNRFRGDRKQIKRLNALEQKMEAC